MKNRFILLFSLVLSLGFGQKKEYRSALKKFNGGDVDGAAQMLADNAQILSSADAKLAPSITFLEGKIAAAKEDFEQAKAKFDQAKTRGVSSSEVDVEHRSFKAKSAGPIRPGAFNLGPKIYPK